MDPLSIDPTVNQTTSLWDDSNTSTRLRLPQMPTMDHHNQHDNRLLTRMVSGVSTVAVRGVNPGYVAAANIAAAAAAAQQQQQQQLAGVPMIPSQGSSHHARMISTGSASVVGGLVGGGTSVALGSPMSMGSTVLNDGGLGSSSSGSGAAISGTSLSFSSSPPTTTASQRSHSRRSSSSSSNMLNNLSTPPPGTTNDIDDGDDNNKLDDDDTEAPPGLDVTYDSMASSYANPSQEWEDDEAAAAGGNNSQHVVLDEEDDDDDDDQSAGTPMMASSNASVTSSVASSYSSVRMIQQTSAFDMANDNEEPGSPPGMTSSSPVPTPTSPNSIMLSFGPNTSVADLKYFAERGCIVALLQALTTPRLVTLGTRMLADYAKMSHRRVAVASNRRILEFVQRTMLDSFRTF